MIAVTGGGGFIGQAVVKQLRDRGEDPAVLDLPGHDVASETFRLPRDCTQVIHLAGVLGTSELFDTPRHAVEVNVGGTLNVLEAAVRVGAGYTGITMPPVFPSIYTATKIGAGHLERAYHHGLGLRVSRVRAFNAFGAGQKHGPGHPQKIVPTFAVSAWRGKPIPVWGDGTQTVDLIHTDDLARMLIAATAFGDDFTLDGGTGQALTVNEVAQMVLDITGSKAGIEYLPMRAGEIPTHIVAEGEGWDRVGCSVPNFSRAQLVTTVNWYRAYA